MSDFSGEFDSILANDNAQDQAIVEVLPTDGGFSSSRCGGWKQFVAGPGAESFGAGDWAVNEQIVPGRYQSSGASSCYWERASGFTHGFDDIIANDNVEGTAIVEIAPGDARFTSSRCGQWNRVG